MKVIKLIGLGLIMILNSCYSGANKGKDEVKTLYRAINKNDTATFDIKLNDKEFYGQLEINYRGAYKDSGGVSGIVKDSILKGTYRFRHYGIEKWHSIPVSFLKKDNQLIMGEGSMEIYMGMYYFKKNTPINYQNTKFVFEKTH